METLEQKIKAIYNRELAIYSVIFLGGVDNEEKKLDAFFKKVSPTGDTRFLSRRDRFFSYCKERDVWYGSKNAYGYIPFIPLKDLIETK